MKKLFILFFALAAVVSKVQAQCVLNFDPPAGGPGSSNVFMALPQWAAQYNNGQPNVGGVRVPGINNGLNITLPNGYSSTNISGFAIGVAGAKCDCNPASPSFLNYTASVYNNLSHNTQTYNLTPSPMGTVTNASSAITLNEGINAIKVTIAGCPGNQLPPNANIAEYTFEITINKPVVSTINATITPTCHYAFMNAGNYYYKTGKINFKININNNPPFTGLKAQVFNASTNAAIGNSVPISGTGQIDLNNNVSGFNNGNYFVKFLDNSNNEIFITGQTSSYNYNFPTASTFCPAAIIVGVNPVCMVKSIAGQLVNTGNFMFRLGVNNLSQYSGVTAQLFNATTNTALTTPISISIGNVYDFDNSGSGFSTGSFKIKFLDNLGNELFTNDLQSTYSYVSNANLCPVSPINIAATVTPECVTYLGSNTGKIKFKATLNGSINGINGLKAQVYNATTGVAIGTAVMIPNGVGVYSLNNGGPGFANGTYNVKFLDNNNNEYFTTGQISSYSYNYSSGSTLCPSGGVISNPPKDVIISQPKKL